jgi:hypothetical protein
MEWNGVMCDAAAIASSITVNVPGGNELFGVDDAGSYNVHGVMQVSNMFLLRYMVCHMGCDSADV